MTDKPENTDISIKLRVPKPANFLHMEGMSTHTGASALVDVGDLSPDTVEALAEAIKQAFIDNADRRRNSE